MENHELRLLVPCYVGEQRPTEKAEYAPAAVPLLAYADRGLRIVLGSHDPEALMPDIQIERRPHGWAIFLHPLGGSDPCGLIYFHDDGRSWLAKERGGATPELAEVDQIPPEIDAC